MQEKTKEPEIRFAGFTGAWEQRKLGNLGETYTGLSGKSKEDFGHGTAKFITYMNVYSNPVSDPEGTDLIEVDNRQNTVRKGDVLFTTSSETPEEVGMSSVVFESIENTYLNSFCFGYRPKIEFNNFYLAFLLRSGGFRKNIIFLAQGISRYNISKNAVMNIPIPIPAKEEQEAIGDFFKHLDALLTLHQRKYEKLLNIKKSMLEKMFPKEGEVVPEIRFKGFTGAWEQREVSQLLLERNTQAPKSSEYPLMAFIANEGIAPKGERYDRSSLVTDEINKLYKRTERGDFIYSSNNLETGSIGLNNYGKASISPVYSIFSTTENADSDFIGHRLVRRDFIKAMVKWRQGVIYGQWRIHESDFLRISICAPSVPEQQKIGRFLRQIDTLLTLHQRKLEMLKNVKQAFLEKMFV